MQRRYGITPARYAAMLKEQDGRCAICDQPAGRRRLAVDHKHETGKIRGLLCTGCNTALGLFGDNTAVLRAAIQYLKSST